MLVVLWALVVAAAKSCIEASACTVALPEHAVVLCVVDTLRLAVFVNTALTESPNNATRP